MLNKHIIPLLIQRQKKFHTFSSTGDNLQYGNSKPVDAKIEANVGKYVSKLEPGKEEGCCAGATAKNMLLYTRNQLFINRLNRFVTAKFFNTKLIFLIKHYLQHQLYRVV